MSKDNIEKNNHDNCNHIEKESKHYFNESILDDGQIAFMQWLNSEDKTSVNNPLFLKKYENNKKCILHDNQIDLDINVTMEDGIPICKYCNNDSCAHVGFVISTMQLHDRKEILIENTELLDLFE